jgi:hypothetical protein
LLGVALSVTLLACGTNPSAPPSTAGATRLPVASAVAGLGRATPQPPRPTVTPPGSTAAPARSHLVVGILPWRLNVGLSRAIAFADGDTVVLAGGLTADGTTGDISRIDVATGRISDGGHLRRPVHDASGAMIGGRQLVFGGGSSVAGSAIQVLIPGKTGQVIGTLPAVRADLSAVVVGARAYVVGGGSANGPDPGIWATSDGTGARLVGRLRIGVRYAATAVSGASIYVFGGATPSGDRREIQRFDTTTGRTSIVGLLPVRLSHAASMTLDGRILVIGGTSSEAIWSFDPDRASVTRVGRLPYPVSDAAAVVIGDRGYLLGGEDPHPLDTVISLELQ